MKETQPLRVSGFLGKNIDLTQEQVTHFNTNGFLSLDRITEAEDFADLRRSIIGLFASKAPKEQGRRVSFEDKAESEAKESGFQQILSPSIDLPALKKTRCFRNAKLIASQLLGEKVYFYGDHALCKKASIGGKTVWHQDEAFRDPSIVLREVSIWIPLQDVDQRNGCMQYIPGSHKSRVHEHGSPGGDKDAYVLECREGFDPHDAVACPLPAGGCAIHDGRTIHGAGTNNSDGDRYAYVVIFSTAPKKDESGRTFAWLKGRTTKSDAKRSQWKSEVGILRFLLWRARTMTSLQLLLALRKLREKFLGK